MPPTRATVLRWAQRVLWTLVGVSFLYLLFGWPVGREAALELGPPLSSSAQPYPRYPAPPLYATTLGGARFVADTGGLPLLLVFWAPWCGPCRREMPSLDRLAFLMKGRLRVLALASAYDSPQEAVNVARQNGLLHAELLFDVNSQSVRSYEVHAYPSAFLIDRAGILRYRLQGARDWDEPSALADCETLAALGQAPAVRASQAAGAAR